MFCRETQNELRSFELKTSWHGV